RAEPRRKACSCGRGSIRTRHSAPDHPEVRVLEARRVLGPVPEKPVHPDVAEPDQREPTQEPADDAGSKPKRRRRSSYRRPPGRPPKHGTAMLTRVLRTVPLDTVKRLDLAGQLAALHQAATKSPGG